MLIPKYTITNSILKNIASVEASRELIQTINLSLQWLGKLQAEALERVIYHSLHLEGSKLSLDEVVGVVNHSGVNLPPDDLQEVLNLKEALVFIDRIVAQVGEDGSYFLTLETILELHKILTQSLLPDNLSGTFRLRQLIVKNVQTAQSFSPPPAAEIPYLMEDLVNFLNSEEGKQIHPLIKAGVAHFEIFRLHPFSTFSHSLARLVTSLILYLEGYSVNKLFFLDEYFDLTQKDYYLILQAICQQPVLDTHERDLTSWLEYLSFGASLEMGKLKDKLRRIAGESRAKDQLGEEVTLNERQILIMEYLHKNKYMQNKDFRKIFPDHSDDTVLRELKFLIKKGLLKKEGGTKNARYVLVES